MRRIFIASNYFLSFILTCLVCLDLGSRTAAGGWPSNTFFIFLFFLIFRIGFGASVGVYIYGQGRQAWAREE